ncbi:hypothetical protein H696_06210 [Fonticula alba]|uniref:CBF1-interacting co-repressor CIR N-terminal domain-containing protein n=1 Tax=Fonticula alba TaxID=691883 RepID=A0A058Z094_FONAL|nr:hypothetical protein H696_06210 [Fonticula alba]KCV67358.1 hypothetical protein H696_06210 [Fonticula alba]|eukprot:XP_009498231.1 hypothetical protein H696_06210 [Fonticula alba]
MNLLPKKSWHIRRSDNLARIERDEAAAEAEQTEHTRRQVAAERTDRFAALRARAGLPPAPELVTELPPEEQGRPVAAAGAPTLASRGPAATHAAAEAPQVAPATTTTTTTTTSRTMADLEDFAASILGPNRPLPAATDRRPPGQMDDLEDVRTRKQQEQRNRSQADFAADPSFRPDFARQALPWYAGGQHGPFSQSEHNLKRISERNSRSDPNAALDNIFEAVAHQRLQASSSQLLLAPAPGSDIALPQDSGAARPPEAPTAGRRETTREKMARLRAERLMREREERALYSPTPGRYESPRATNDRFFMAVPLPSAQAPADMEEPRAAHRTRHRRHGGSHSGRRSRSRSRSRSPPSRRRRHRSPSPRRSRDQDHHRRRA